MTPWTKGELTTGTVMIQKKIKLLRISRHLTQLDMADNLCICPKQYRRIESGVAPLTWNRIIKIAQVLNVDVDYLTSNNNPLPPLNRSHRYCFNIGMIRL